MKVIPTSGEVVREGLIVLGGAILAAIVIGSIPPLRDWIKRQWGGAQSPANPWE